MAKKSIATYVKDGYGQVEPNHLSAQRNGQIYAQLPAAESIEVLENGQFAKYDLAEGEVNFTGAGEWMLVYNEEKYYEEKFSRKDFALKTEDATRGIITPRLFKTNVGDIFTTNFLGDASYEEGDKLTVKGNGILTKDESASEGMIWQVGKVYTLADGQAAAKIIRIQ